MQIQVPKPKGSEQEGQLCCHNSGIFYVSGSFFQEVAGKLSFKLKLQMFFPKFGIRVHSPCFLMEDGKEVFCLACSFIESSIIFRSLAAIWFLSYQLLSTWLSPWDSPFSCMPFARRTETDSSSKIRLVGACTWRDNMWNKHGYFLMARWSQLGMMSGTRSSRKPAERTYLWQRATQRDCKSKALTGL